MKVQRNGVWRPTRHALVACALLAASCGGGGGGSDVTATIDVMDEEEADQVLEELWEETELNGVCGPLVGWVEQMSVDHHFVILDFRVVILDDGPPIAGSDADEAAWVDLASLDGVPLVDGLAWFLAEHGLVPGSVLSLD